jgi:hypothetical protein
VVQAAMVQDHDERRAHKEKTARTLVRYFPLLNLQ